MYLYRVPLDFSPRLRYNRTMKFSVPPALVNLLILLSFLTRSTVSSEDATVDQLLKKLPPPEKFVPSPTDRIVR